MEEKKEAVTTEEPTEEVQTEEPDLAASAEEGGPSDEQRDARLKRERDDARKQLDEQKVNAEYWQRQASLNQQQPAYTPPAEQVTREDPEDLATNGRVQELERRLAEQEQTNVRGRIQQINDAGYERHPEEYGQLSAIANQAAQQNKYVWDAIMNARDPVEEVMHQGRQFRGDFNRQPPAADDAQRIVNNSKSVQTLTGVQGGTGKATPELQRQMKLTAAEYKQLSKADRDAAYRKAGDAGLLTEK